MRKIVVPLQQKEIKADQQGRDEKKERKNVFCPLSNLQVNTMANHSPAHHNHIIEWQSGLVRRRIY